MATAIVDLASDVSVSLKVVPSGDHYDALSGKARQPLIPDLHSYVYQEAVAAGSDEYGLGDLSIGTITITNVTVWAFGRVRNSAQPDVAWLCDLDIGGSAQGAQDFGFAGKDPAWKSVSFDGSWTQAEFNAATVTLSCEVTAEKEQNVWACYVVVTYETTEEETPTEPEEPAAPGMGEVVSAAYKALARAKHRRPTLRAVAYYGTDYSQELDITQWLTGAQVSYSLEHEASTGQLTLLDKDGMFDPLTSGAYSQVLAEHNKVKVWMGYSDQVYQVFTGLIAAGSVSYQAGRPDVITVPLWDMGKTFWEQRVTSDLYQGEGVNDILTSIFVSKGGMAAGDIDLAGQTYNVAQIQFIDEVLMDIGGMLMLPNLYRLYFNYEGKLVSRGSEAPGTSSWDYSGNEVELVGYEWDDPTVNRVVVTGRNLEPAKQYGEEVMWYEVHADVLQRDSWTWVRMKWEERTEGVEYSECRVEAAPGNTRNDEWWAKVQGPYYYDWGVAWRFPSSRDDTLHAYFYGKRVSYYVPRVQGQAEDAALVAKYGAIVEEIDNPVMQDAASCATLAEAILEREKAYRYRMTIRVVQNLSHEPGDRITFQHPRSGAVIAAQVLRVTHTTMVGGECATELDLLKL